jgi:hypothetical protein
MNIAVEGVTDGAVVGRILRDHGVGVIQVSGLHGKGHLDLRLPAFNSAARFSDWLVVRDLDQDADCAATLVKAKLRAPSKGMHYRVAVRSIEAWLLADVQGMTSFFQVRNHEVPHDPEALGDPKLALVDLARRSRSRVIREDMVPSPQTTARVGPGFVAQVMSFVDSKWSWKRAMRRSDSLRRCVDRIAELT